MITRTIRSHRIKVSYLQSMNNKILIIAGTNRKGSMSAKVAEYYLQVLQSKSIDVALYRFDDLALEWLNVNHPNAEFTNIQEQLIIPATKFIFVAPEYNGSVPGILKLFIDSCNIGKCFNNKKAALVGVSEGRSGNLRGLDHLTSILNYVKVNVLHYKVNIPHISSQVKDAAFLPTDQVVATIHKQLDELLTF